MGVSATVCADFVDGIVKVEFTAGKTENVSGLSAIYYKYTVRTSNYLISYVNCQSHCFKGVADIQIFFIYSLMIIARNLFIRRYYISIHHFYIYAKQRSKMKLW